MDTLSLQVALRFAGNVVELRPRAVQGPRLTISGKHYVLSTDSGPLMGDSTEALEGGEGGARLIQTPTSNKWRYLWAYSAEEDTVAMWRASDGDEKLYDTGKHAATYLVRLAKKGQLNRVEPQEFQQIDAFMRKRQHETVEELKQVVEQNKNDQERLVDELAKEFFEKFVAHHIDRAVKDVVRGVVPIGFKPFGPKGDPAAVTRQQASHVIGTILTREMTVVKLESYAAKHGFDMDSVHNQTFDWAIGDVRDMAFERYLPAR